MRKLALAYILAPSGLDVATLRAQRRGLTAPNLCIEPKLRAVTLWSEALARQGEDALPIWQPPAFNPALPFTLTCGKTVAFCHSLFCQIDSLRKRLPQPVAELAPDFAISRNVKPGDSIIVRTATGEVHFRTEINSRLSHATVWGQYGWWCGNAMRGIACDVLRPDQCTSTAPSLRRGTSRPSEG